MLDSFLAPKDRQLLAHAADYAKVWLTRAPDLFNVTLDNETARSAIDAYARQIAVPSKAALDSLSGDRVSFHAISLDASGKPAGAEPLDVK